MWSLRLRPGLRVGLIVGLYGALLAACFTTLSDARIRVAAVAVVLGFFGLTLLHPPRPAPSPWGREADGGEPEAAEPPGTERSE